MLDHLRAQVIDALGQARQITLATDGIAGLQTSILPCESLEMILFVLAPQTSDHLVNIIDQPECVAVTKAWELRGVARRVPFANYALALSHTPDAVWSALIEIRPTRLQLARPDGTGFVLTIDLD